MVNLYRLRRLGGCHLRGSPLWRGCGHAPAPDAALQLLAAELVDLGLTSSEINVLANLADGRGRIMLDYRGGYGRPGTFSVTR